MFNTKTVAGICDSFVSQLETVEIQQQTIADKQAGIISDATAKQEAARDEVSAAATAIVNIRALFGQETQDAEA